MKRTMITIIFLLATLKLIAPVDDRVVILGPVIYFDKYELSWYSIDYWMREFDIQNREIAKRQVYHETGNLTSRFCRECNNLFGMRKPRKRQTTAIGRDNGMSVYPSFVESIEDYGLWQECFYKEGDYYSFLKSHGYATDPLYIPKLKNLSNGNFKLYYTN